MLGSFRASGSYLFIICAVLAIAYTPAHAATTIEFWQFWTDSKIKPTIKSIVSDFEEQNPEIKVNISDLTWANGYEKIVLAFNSKTAPDVVELGSDWLAQFAESGHLADISESVGADSSQFHGWGMSTYETRIFGWPWILGTRVMFYNRDLLSKAGYEPDFVPINIKDFREALYKVDSLSDKIYGWGSNTAEKHRLYKKYLPFFWTNGAQIFSDDGKYCVISSDFAIDALKFYKELHDSCGYVANQRGIEDAFLAGRIGCIISGDWLLKRIKLENKKMNFATGLMPGTKFPGLSFLGGEILSITNASENKEAALKFVRFFTSPENQLRFCQANMSSTPSSKQAQQDEYFLSNANLQTFNKQIRLANHPPVDPHWVQIEDIIEDAVEEVLFGKSISAAEALRQARFKIEALRK